MEIRSREFLRLEGDNVDWFENYHLRKNDNRRFS